VVITVGKSLNIRVFLITMSQVQKQLNREEEMRYEDRMVQLKLSLKELPLRTREGRRFAKHLYLISRRLKIPIDVVGVLLYELKMDLKTDSIDALARDVADVLSEWFRWLYYTMFLTCDLAVVRVSEIDSYFARISVNVCIENRVWEFELTLNGEILYPEVTGFYFRN